MIIEACKSIGLAVLAQGTGADGNAVGGSTLAIGVVALVAGSLFIWTQKRLRLTEEKLNQANAAIETKTTEARNTASGERKAQQSVADKQEKIGKLKKDLATQRKKNHDLAEELKGIKKDHGAEITRLREQYEAHAAFAPEPKPVEAPKEVAKAKEPEKTEPTAPVAEPAPTAELDTVATERDALKSKLTNLKSDHKKARSQLKQTRDQLERFRRIDLISKKQTELLEDKLLSYGRRYYDLISEMAAVKGEVVPPRPSDLVEAEKRAAQQAEEHTGDDSDAHNDALVSDLNGDTTGEEVAEANG